jgi:hypothetical protein
MADGMTGDELRQKLRDLEAEIADLRRTSSGIATSLGNNGDGVENAEDIAAGLTGIEENEGVLRLLEQRRDSIKQRLDALGS